MKKTPLDIASKIGFICDMDGLIYHGNKILPGVPEFVKEISEEGGMKVLPIPGFFDEGDEV